MWPLAVNAIFSPASLAEKEVERLEVYWSSNGYSLKGNSFAELCLRGMHAIGGLSHVIQI